jgi:hypothetical protein
MAPAPSARLTTITWPKGSITAPRGLLVYLFGDLAQTVAWASTTTNTDPVTGRRVRRYGTRQRSSARAGEAMTVVLNNGEQFSVRITGSHYNFLDQFLGRGAGEKVANVYSERGTIYGPQVVQL